MSSCKVGEVSVDLILDLGAKVSIMTKKFYDQFLSDKFNLLPANVVLQNYSGEPIACCGCFPAPVQIRGSRRRKARFFVTACGRSIMGVNLFDVLGGTVLLRYMRNVSKSPSTADAFPEVGAVTAVSLDTAEGDGDIEGLYTYAAT